jgi:hypothetical protein
MDRQTPQRRHAILALVIAASISASPMTAIAQDVALGNLGTQGFRIDGIVGSDNSGRSVSGAGDVNGDGVADVIVGAPNADPGGDATAGEAYVLFGKSDATPVDLANLGAGGFRIPGVDPSDSLGLSVSGAGDVNGDVLADLIVGASGATVGADIGAGETYIVFGKADAATVDLSNLGVGGFRIDGIDAGDGAGSRVSGAGDVNGDGLADLIIGARGGDPGGNSGAGEVYVVFGQADSTAVDLADLGTRGFRIEGIAADDGAGESVSGAGDINGDGLADVVIGGFPLSSGLYAAHVVFGRTSSSTVELANLGANGFRIDGSSADGWFGYSVSGAGDVNGDALADLIIGAPKGQIGNVSDVGVAYVVFGKASSTPIDLAELGTGGFRIDGREILDYAGYSVAGAGDVNGDGLADMIVGAPRPVFLGIGPGEAHVIFGKADAATVDLDTLAAGGFRITGADGADDAGISVSGAGDINGDGLADVIVGAFTADPDGDLDAGESYVVFSTQTPLASIQVQARSANGNPPRTAFGITGDGSNDSTPDARAWLDFGDGNDASSSASTETITLLRTAGAYPSPGAAVAWRLETTRGNWTSAEIRIRYLDNELLADEGSLQIVHSPDGTGPFTPLASVVNPLDNTITAGITQAGVFHLGQFVPPPEIFFDGFEALTP